MSVACVSMTIWSPNRDGRRKRARKLDDGEAREIRVFEQPRLVKAGGREQAARTIVEPVEETRIVDDAGRVAVAPFDRAFAADDEHEYSFSAAILSVRQ